MKNFIFLCLFAFVFFAGTSAQTYSWVGSKSYEFSDSLNWSPNTWKPMSPSGAETVFINGGNPNDPIFYLGSATLRYGRFNTGTNANFTNRGAIYAWNNDSINGSVLLDSYSTLNIRAFAYIGNKSTGVVTLKGSLATKYDVYVGYGSAGNGKLVIDDGTLYVGRYLYVGNSGSTGKIVIKGVGGISLVGNQVSSMQTLINAGKITTEDPNAVLEAVYDNSSTTTVQIKQDMTGMFVEYSSYVLLKNDIITAKIEKATGKVLSVMYKGKEMVSQSGSHITAYYDWTDGNNFEGLSHCAFTVVQNNDSVVDLSFKRAYTPELGDAIGGDMNVHYVIKPGLSGLYTYSELEHKPTYPDVGLGSWRLVYSLGNDGTNFVCEKIYVDSLRHWEMPKLTDTYTTTGIQEIVYMTSGARAGHYDGKYEYSTEYWNHGTWGFASDVNKVGTWMVFGSHEFFNGGPTYHDLNSAAGIIHVCLNGLHYNLNSFTVKNGDEWKKIYGPFLIYFNNQDTGDQSWADAQEQAKKEEKLWPYAWLKNNAEYPLADARGAVKGQFKIMDKYKPEVTGKNAWVGVTQVSNDYGQWQQEGRNYQYWGHVDSAGNFTIPNVRPGTYSFFAFSDGEVDQYSQANVVVTAGNTTNLGSLIWNIPRNKGRIAWEIGYPNRSASEFAHGHTDYFEGYVYNNFYKEFANPIEYDVSQKNWSTALPYAHGALIDSQGNLNAWKWHINFTLPSDIPTQGNATLTIAYAGSDHAQQWIYVNNDNSIFAHYYPENGGGNAFLRQSIHATYGIDSISIPMSMLNKGANTITLLMPSTSSGGNHIMYDYISLETPYYDCNGDLNGTAFKDSCGNCAGGNTGVTPILDKTKCGLGVVNINNTKWVYAYPNPFVDTFTLGCNSEISYQILSISGRLLETGKTSSNTELGKNLPAGAYVLKINQGDKIKSFKLLKKR